MKNPIFLGAAILAMLLPAAHANPVSRRAAITGGGGNGRCTIEVSVDHSAEVEVSGDLGLLTTVAGQPAGWRGFQCNVPLPSNPVDFRFVKTGGRGAVRLIQDPRSTRGRAVVRIDDPQGGRASYTFDLQWRGTAGGGRGPGPGPGGGWTPGPQPPPPGQWPGSGPGPGGFPIAKAIRTCHNSVTERLNGYGYSSVAFERTIPDDNPGRHDWVTGTVAAKRWFGTTWFSFSCSVDFNSGRVRSVDVQRR